MSAVTGVFSLDLSTTVLPQARAGASFHASINSGKFLTSRKPSINKDVSTGQAVIVPGDDLADHTHRLKAGVAQVVACTKANNEQIHKHHV